MKKLSLVIVLMALILLTGCFKDKTNDETVAKDDIITAILELVKKPEVKQSAAEVQNVSNGVYSGIYLKLGATLYMYSFTDLASLDSTEKSNFITRWASATDGASFIVLENKAISLTTAKTVFGTPGAKLSESMQTGVDSSDAGFAIQPSTMVVVYPKAVNSALTIRADRNIGTRQIGSAECDWMSGVTVDNSGNIYALMYYNSDLDYAADGRVEGRIVKYSKKGEEWSKDIQGNQISYSGMNTSEIRVENIGTDTAGNIYVGGYEVFELVTDNDYRYKKVFLKYDAEGNLIIKKNFLTTGYQMNNGYGVFWSSETVGDSYIDKNGNVYYIGWAHDGTSDNIYVDKVNSSGDVVWTKIISTNEGEAGYRVYADESGNVYACGYTYGNIGSNINAGNADGFIVKYNSQGVEQWSKMIGTDKPDFAADIKTDSLGNVYVCGYTEGTLPNIDNVAHHGGYYDLFLSKYSSSGELLWTKLEGTASRDYAFRIALDSSDNVYLTGNTEGNFEGIANSGGYDIIFKKYDSNGNKIWTKLIGSPAAGEENGRRIVVSGNSVYLAGYIKAALAGQTSFGKDDAFIKQYKLDGTEIN